MDTGDTNKGLTCKEGKKHPLPEPLGDQERGSQETNGTGNVG